VWGFFDATRAASDWLVGMMRRPAHGATRRPPVTRPGNGFGRSLRPGPRQEWRSPETIAEVRAWDPVELLIVNLTTSSDDAVNA
jgi:hypothetical protein